MSLLSEDFNKISALDPKDVLEQDFNKLSKEKQELFLEFRRALEQQNEERRLKMAEQRAGRVASNANMLGGRGALEPGGERLHQIITPQDVETLMARAEQDEVPLDQLTPQSKAEQYIQIAFRNTLVYERQQEDAHSALRFESERKLMDGLFSLDSPDTRELSQDSLRRENGRSITDIFNNAGRSL